MSTARRCSKISLSCLLLAVCCLVPLAAQEAPSLEEFLKSVQPAGGAAGEGLLFYEIPEGIEAAAGTAVDFRVRHEGRVFLHERLTLGRVEGKVRPAVELLGWNQEKLDELRRLAAQPNASVKIAVSVAGRLVEELSFAELVRHGERLRERGFYAVEAKSEIVAPRGKPADGLRAFEKITRQECADRCLEEYYFCSTHCDPYGPNSECDRCRTDLETCEDFCLQCPITYPIQQSRTIVSQTGTGLQVCAPNFLPNQSHQKRIYYEIITQFRITRFRYVTECDGSSRIETLSVQYVSEKCWGMSSFSCVFPQLFPPSCRFAL